MTIKEVKDLVKLLDESNLAEFHYKTKDVDLKIRNVKYFDAKAQQVVAAPIQVQQPATAPAPTAAPRSDLEPVEKPKEETPTNLIEIKSPMVGTFYRSSSPDKPAFASVGDNIQNGSVVCIIEAMKLFNEIESEFSGKIVKVLVEDATPVEYDQVLFLVEP